MQARTPNDSEEAEHGSLRELVDDLEVAVMEKIEHRQSGVGTFFDDLLLWGLRILRQKEQPPGGEYDYASVASLCRRYAQSRGRDRLVPYSRRQLETAQRERLPWEVSDMQMAATQGVRECLLWKGLPLFKTVYDLALYPMIIAEVCPGTIIELGSGTGASALWFADLLRIHGLAGRVYSIDLRKPTVADSHVCFIAGDCRNIAQLIAPAELACLAHPWLVIEDMHVDTAAVISYLARFSRAGDYFIVEDSTPKRDELAAFDREWGARFRVDTRYTDFFGWNATCSKDSIFVRG